MKLVSNPRFAAMMQSKINMKVDTSSLDQEIANYEKQLRQCHSIKSRLMEEIDSLDPDERHYLKRKADLDDRLYKMYDKIENMENSLIADKAKKMAIEADKLTGDNIYKVLICFEKLYAVMDEQERRQLLEALIAEIQIYEEKQPNGQWLKSIKFKLPIIDHDMSLKETLSEVPPEEQKAVKEQIHAQQTEYRQLKKLRWSLLTNGATLHPDKAEHLQAILEKHSNLAVCYAMKEELCRLFSLRDVSQAASAWNAWFDAAMESGIPALVRFAALTEKRLPGLVAHAVFPISTGKLEGFNNKVEVAKRIGYGYRDDAYFFTLVSFLTWMA